MESLIFFVIFIDCGSSSVVLLFKLKLGLSRLKFSSFFLPLHKDFTFVHLEFLTSHGRRTVKSKKMTENCKIWSKVVFVVVHRKLLQRFYGTGLYLRSFTKNVLLCLVDSHRMSVCGEDRRYDKRPDVHCIRKGGWVREVNVCRDLFIDPYC